MSARMVHAQAAMAPEAQYLPAAQPSEPKIKVVLDQKAFWRDTKRIADREGFAVVTGFAGGPIVIYGDRQSHRRCGEGDGTALIGREEVADLLGCNADRLSWKPVREKMEAEGLVGRRIAGRRKMWRREDVIAYAERKVLTGRRGRGRPRKVA